MTRRAWLSALTLLLVIAAARAATSPTGAREITFAATSPGDLRARLRAHLDSVDVADAKGQLDASEAWAFLGLSYRRAGHGDSALAAYAKAAPVLGDRESAIALADLLLARARPGDADAALRALEPLRAEAVDSRQESAHALMTRIAWATAQTGHTHDALALAAVQGEYLAMHAIWARRFAKLAMETGADSTALRLLFPGLVRSRGTDLEALELARRAANRRVRPGELDGVLARARDFDDSLAHAALRATAQKVVMHDGAPLRLWVRPGHAAHTPLILVLPSSADPTLATYDSLVTQLARTGAALALADVRGLRGSANNEFPTADAWIGHEEALLRRTALDVPALLGAALAATHADPRRVALVTDGGLAVAGALALQPANLHTLVLLSPAPAACDRGWLVATLVRSGANTFIQTDPEDVYGNDAIERIAALLPPRRVRVAEASARGSAAELFRHDASLAPRLSRWLTDAWAATPAPRTVQVAPGRPHRR